VCSFIVKLTLSQILQILLEFTHFIFTIINTYLSIRIQYYHKTYKFYQNQQKSGDGPKCSPLKTSDVVLKTTVQIARELWNNFIYFPSPNSLLLATIDGKDSYEPNFMN
jgi:hypothetical protein